MYKFNTPYVFNHGKRFTPIYLQGENCSFYFNSEPIDDINSPYELWVIKSDGTHVAKCADCLLLYVAGAVGYHIYIDNYVFPFIANGEYFLQIWCPSLSVEKFRSNPILVASYCTDTTTPVRFRNNDQLYGVRYDLLPNFYQMFRLPINQIKAIDPRSDRTQYRQSSNGRELRNSKSFRDIYITLEFYWANDEDFAAVSAMLEHTEIYISGNRIIDMTQVKPEKPSEASGQSKGTFDVIVNTYNIPDTIDTFGEFISWGGCTYGIYTTFIDGGGV